MTGFIGPIQQFPANGGSFSATVHREPLQRLYPDAFVTIRDVENALVKATSWVRRNVREWPYQHKLCHRIEGEYLCVYFERVL